MSAVMGPASGNRGSGGLIPTDALATAASVKPSRIPGGSWLVVDQDNRIAKRIEKGL